MHSPINYTPEQPTGCSPTRLTPRNLEPEQLDDLFRRCKQPAFRVAIRVLGNEADALDAVQEGFVKALAHLQDFQARSSFKTWLMHIVYNAALEMGRKRSRAPRPLRADEGHASDARRKRVGTPLDDLAEQELPNVIWGILADLASERQRHIYALWKKEKETAEIARTLRVSVETVRLERRNLLKLLREELNNRGWSTQ
jgi:RNA polymerase sigma-70 factor (ECF subfamily)